MSTDLKPLYKKLRGNDQRNQPRTSRKRQVSEKPYGPTFCNSRVGHDLLSYKDIAV